MADPVKIDSNLTGLNIAEEVALKTLPTVAVDGFDPIWFGQEPNGYSDFGGEISTVARAPIDPSRQNKKGTPTDLNASGGFSTDVTQNNLTRLLQGFFFADARRKPSTESFALGTANTLLSSVTASTKTYAAASGLTPFNKAGYLVKASGFGNAANNGLKTVASATGTTVVVSETTVDEASPPTTAKLHVVGFKFPSADVQITVTAGIPALVSAATNLTQLGLTVGEWVFIGGDGASLKFANNVGYARVGSISTTTVVFDDTTWAPVAEAGTGKTIQLFFGTVIRNEKTASLIKRRSYNIERTLGEGPQAQNPGDLQAEYLEGAVANELTLNVPQADKLTADLSFVACDNTQRSGASGDKIKSATLGATVSAAGEDAINTSSDVYRIKMAINDPATSKPTALFGYVTEGNVSIKNGVTPNKAVGVMGAFDTSAGNFVVGGSVTAYFTDVAAVKAVRNNADVGFNTIYAAQNAGMVWDIPLLGLGGGRLNVEKDQPIKVPLEPAAAENANGYTLMYVNFPYLPNAAMPA
jgi:hypothetical protein